jgi:hypothetical protein
MLNQNFLPHFHIPNLNPFKGMHWKMPKMADISTKPWFFPVYKAVSKEHQKFKEVRTTSVMDRDPGNRR